LVFIRVGALYPNLFARVRRLSSFYGCIRNGMQPLSDSFPK
jgi:hypothetical protein